MVRPESPTRTDPTAVCRVETTAGRIGELGSSSGDFSSRDLSCRDSSLGGEIEAVPAWSAEAGVPRWLPAARLTLAAVTAPAAPTATAIVSSSRRAPPRARPTRTVGARSGPALRPTPIPRPTLALASLAHHRKTQERYRISSPQRRRPSQRARLI